MMASHTTNGFAQRKGAQQSCSLAQRKDAATEMQQLVESVCFLMPVVTASRSGSLVVVVAPWASRAGGGSATPVSSQHDGVSLRQNACLLGHLARFSKLDSLFIYNVLYAMYLILYTLYHFSIPHAQPCVYRLYGILYTIASVAAPTWASSESCSIAPLEV